MRSIRVYMYDFVMKKSTSNQMTFNFWNWSRVFKAGLPC